MLILFVLLAFAVPFTLAGDTLINRTPAAVPVPTPASVTPPYDNYKGVTVGMTADKARAALGSPKDSSAESELWVFSNSETVQLYYDAAKLVTAISITYSGKLGAAPTPKIIFGEEAEVKPDGGIFKMVRYPKAGFWISYNKIGGDEPMVMIAIQKM